MHRYLFSLLSAIPFAVIPCGACAAGPVGGYYTEDRALESPVFGPTGYNQFAISVAISDGIAIVGAARVAGPGNAYLYDSKTGALLHTLSPANDSASNFGRTVAIEGKYAVVGSDQATYVYDANNYQLLHTLPRSFGLDIDNGRVLIGGSGVYDLSSGQRFAQIGAGGTSAALSGDFAVIGYVGNEGGVPAYAVVFDWKAGRYLYDLATAGTPNGFGISVDADGNIAVVGSVGDQGGSAYVFDLRTGQELHRLEEIGRIYQPYRSFGYAVTMHGDIAIVGAYERSDYFPVGPGGQMEYVFEYGAAFAFSAQSGEEIARFTTAGPTTGGLAKYGFSLDYDGSQLIAGTLGWPKKAYVTDFAIPEPTALLLLVSFGLISLAHRPRRYNAIRAVLNAPLSF